MKDKCLKLLQCKGFNKKNTENSCKDLGSHDLKSKQKTSKKDMKYMKYLKIDQKSKVNEETIEIVIYDKDYHQYQDA